MQNNTKHFIEQHPDFQPMIDLYIKCWKEQFDEDIYVDISESLDDADVRRKFYSSHGYKFKDENCFGMSLQTVGIIQCFVAENHQTAIDERSLGKRTIAVDECFMSGCSELTFFNIPEGVTSIGTEFLEDCANLESVSIPKSLTAFEGGWICHACPNLKTITVDEANPVYDSRANCNAVIETATDCLVLGCTNSKIPNTVKEIGPSAFELCKINSLVIPKGVRKIGCAAFCGCFTLKTSIPNGVEVIEFYAFNACHELKDIVIPQTVRIIGDHAFDDCRNLSVVTFTSSKIELHSAVFDNCKKLKKIIVPKNGKKKFVEMLGEEFADKIITQ